MTAKITPEEVAKLKAKAVEESKISFHESRRKMPATYGYADSVFRSRVYDIADLALEQAAEIERLRGFEADAVRYRKLVASGLYIASPNGKGWYLSELRYPEPKPILDAAADALSEVKS